MDNTNLINNMPAPPEAMKLYVDAEKTAADAYHKYWRDLFATEGIIFAPVPPPPQYTYGHCSYQATANGYTLGMDTRPSRFEGVYIVVTFKTQPSSQTWQSRKWVKIKSARGFALFMRKLHRNYWP